MGTRKRPPLTAREIGILAGISLFAIALAGGLVAVNIHMAGLARGGGEFFAAWAGSRTFLYEQRSPYSSEVATAAQRLAYGRVAIPGENPFWLTVPFFLLQLFFPLAIPSQPLVARGLWLCLDQAALAGTVSVTFALAEWRPPRMVALLLGISAAAGFYAVAAMQSGTAAVVLGMLYAGTLWALQVGRDELAGCLLALSLFMWEVGGLFLFMVASHIVWERRWGAFGGLAMTLVILVGASFLLYPGWLLPFLTSTVGQMRALYGQSSGSVLLRLSAERGLFVSRATTVLAACLIIFEWWSARGGGFRRFVWLCCLSLAITPLLGLRTELANFVVLAPLPVMVCAASAERGRLSGWLALSAAAGIFLVPWILFSRTLSGDGRVAQASLFLFYPLISIAGLYWTRWWFLRPQRTWLDHVRALGG